MYRRTLSALLRWTLRLDVFINRVWPSDLNPLYYTGGFANLFLFILVLSGLFIFFYYVPSLGGAHASVAYLTEQVPYGGLIRGIHRYAADAFIVSALLHLFRNWFTDRYLFSRDSPWISGMFMLLLGGFVGVTGYILVWDDRGLAVLSVFVDMLQSIPGAGDSLAALLVGGPGLWEGTLPRVLLLHVGPASALYLLLWWHYVRLRHPKVWPPATWVLISLGVVTLLAALVPAVSGTPAVPGAAPRAMAVDVFFLLPFWLAGYLPSMVIVGAVAVLFAAGFVIPYVSREPPRQMGVRHAGVAQVVDGNCTGCELCYYDCPYNAIVMVPSPYPGLTRAAANRKLLAVVIDSRCVECGICIGACPFEALELPGLLEADVRQRVAEAVRA
ncbi:MAG: cytochrome b N-terminal domain-containing protein [Armatimonadota bacterium]|nr:cytochrome b N-terminal domain-containing protein [Armatimonadota bacterium]MDR7520618.1 cytochrome b N-terminal domain-containing protein [Armatimonadota bacterium]MDR7550489.1 cytochrome b N-terminal domain-containing protein [Armatimonadota bacterium]